MDIEYVKKPVNNECAKILNRLYSDCTDRTKHMSTVVKIKKKYVKT